MEEYSRGIMKLNELKSLLRAHPSSVPRFILPDGDEIPAHFHITEVGHITKRFIDCGGLVHDRAETCLLQTWLGDDVDHRLNAGRFARILDLGAKVLPHDDLNVEVEYDCCVVAQYPIASATVAGELIELQLTEKQTDCLARHRRTAADACCVTERSPQAESAACC
jgi:hypothetical protein